LRIALAFVRFQLEQLVFVLAEVDAKLLRIQLGDPPGRVGNMFLLRLENLAHRLGLRLAAHRQFLLRGGRVLLSAGLQVREQLADVARGSLLQLADDLRRQFEPLDFQQRILQQRQRLRFGVFGVGGERAFADARLRPAGRDRDQFFMQPGGPFTIETEPTEQDDTGIRQLQSLDV
jgi:hypothetical protein